jgi:hypothetical protein
MKSKETIEKRIDIYKEKIDKFRLDKELTKEDKNNAIFTLQELIRQLKWVLK